MLAGNTAVAAGVLPKRSIGARVALALIPVVWALNLLDLLFTMLAYQMEGFRELNPLASSLGWHNQILLKLGALVFFSAVCVSVRHHRIMQLGCYLITAVYSALAVLWLRAFNFLLTPHYFQKLLLNF